MKTIVKNIGGKNIIATAEEHLSPQIEKLLYLLTKVEDSKLVDGFSIQVGWSLLFYPNVKMGIVLLSQIIQKILLRILQKI